MQIVTLLLALNLICPKPEIINQTNRAWNTVDTQVLDRQTKVCKHKGFAYLRLLIREDDLHFGVICGYARDCIDIGDK